MHSGIGLTMIGMFSAALNLSKIMNFSYEHVYDALKCSLTRFWKSKMVLDEAKIGTV